MKGGYNRLTQRKAIVIAEFQRIYYNYNKIGTYKLQLRRTTMNIFAFVIFGSSVTDSRQYCVYVFPYPSYREVTFPALSRRRVAIAHVLR